MDIWKITVCLVSILGIVTSFIPMHNRSQSKPAHIKSESHQAKLEIIPDQRNFPRLFYEENKREGYKTINVAGYYEDCGEKKGCLNDKCVKTRDCDYLITWFYLPGSKYIHFEIVRKKLVDKTAKVCENSGENMAYMAIAFTRRDKIDKAIVVECSIGEKANSTGEGGAASRVGDKNGNETKNDPGQQKGKDNRRKRNDALKDDAKQEGSKTDTKPDNTTKNDNDTINTDNKQRGAVLAWQANNKYRRWDYRCEEGAQTGKIKFCQVDLDMDWRMVCEFRIKRRLVMLQNTYNFDTTQYYMHIVSGCNIEEIDGGIDKGANLFSTTGTVNMNMYKDRSRTQPKFDQTEMMPNANKKS